VVTKRELSTTAKLSAFKSIFVMFLTYGNESCVMTKECYLKCKRQRWDLCEEFKVWHFATKCAVVKFVKVCMLNHFSESRDPKYVRSAM